MLLAVKANKEIKILAAERSDFEANGFTVIDTAKKPAAVKTEVKIPDKKGRAGK